MFESVEETIRRERARMAELRSKSLLPAGLLELVEKTLEAQAGASARTKAFEPERAKLETLDRVVLGAPLVPRRSFGFDPSPAAGLFAQLLDILEGLGGPMAQAAGVVRAGGEPVMLEAFDAFVKDESAPFAAFAEKVPQAPRALTYLAQSSLTPQITAFARAVAGKLPKDRTWEQATCPVCGSLPLVSSLVGKEGVRVNTCSFCRASYRTVRLQCPYCQERDASKLPFFTADEEPGFRVDACLSCQGYLKTADFRQLDRLSVPALDDLESMALDIMAAKRGFMRPTLSAWGF